jgi:serine phosphatase RsbU (regulator of sigma subunit)
MSRYYEVLMSTFSRPVYDENGEAAAVIGADVPMQELSSLASQFYKNLQQSIWPIVLFQLIGLLVLGFIIYRSIASVRRLNEAQAEKDFINRELGIASRIQQAMLPTEKLDDGTVDIAGSLVPAKLVGGDFFDYVVRDSKLFFNIGDVCGKGMPAALVMSMTQAVFRTIASKEDDPARIVRDMNAMACKGNSTGMFATLFVGVLDLTNGKLSYSNAGHDRPIVISGAGARSLEAESHLPIGVVEDTAYRTQETQIAPGDMVLLYTDGLTEAMNAEHELFGMQRIFQTIRGNEASPQQLLDGMSQAVAEYVAGAEQSDDLTMLAILYRGAPVADLAQK